MDALTLHELGHVFSSCELCVRNITCKLIILIISFILTTFDTITDWINYNEWRGVGGFDQYYFVFIFQMVFMSVAIVGTLLWIVELFVIIKKSESIYRQHIRNIKYSVDFLPESKNVGEILQEPGGEITMESPTEQESTTHCNLEEQNEQKATYEYTEVRVHDAPEVKPEQEVRIHVDLQEKPEQEVRIHDDLEEESEQEDRIHDDLEEESEQEDRIHDDLEEESEQEDRIHDDLEEESEQEDRIHDDLEEESEQEVRIHDDLEEEPEQEVRIPQLEPEKEVQDGKGVSNKVQRSKSSDANEEENRQCVDLSSTEPEARTLENRSTANCEIGRDDCGPSNGQNKEFLNKPAEEESIQLQSNRNGIVDTKSEFGPLVSYCDETATIPAEEDLEEKGETFTKSTAVDKLGIAVIILVSVLEDLPVVVAVFYTTVMPLCGVRTEKFASTISLATIISSMLNSLWTMVVLSCKLWTCRRKRLCCRSNIRQEDNEKKNSQTDKKGKKWIPYGKKKLNKSKSRTKKACVKCGKVLLSLVLFLLLSSTFTLGLWTVGNVLGFISLEFVSIAPFYLYKQVHTGYIGPGLDAKPDQAMFVYFYHPLDYLQVVLTNSKSETVRKSASFNQILNRVYIGQLQELQHLKNRTLAKAVPCTRIFPFLENIDIDTFKWFHSDRAPDQIDLLNCKVIFTLRYHPTNNNWQPFTNFIHDFANYITLEYGIHIKTKDTCPIWFNSFNAETFLSNKVKDDVISYTCNSACGNDTGICRDAETKIISTHGSQVSVGMSDTVYLVIHDQNHGDTCYFEALPRLDYTGKFCDEAWASIDPVKVPQYITETYPQFISMPLTYPVETLFVEVVPDDTCDRLWDQDDYLYV